MYRHSIQKRHDGDHVTIWIDRSFIEGDVVEGPEDNLSKRQKTRIPQPNTFYRGTSDRCIDHKRQDHTGPNESPMSGGVQAIYRWGRDTEGSFDLPNKSWRTMIIGGSNSGANALYKARRKDGPNSYLGSHDVRNDADWTQKRAKKYSGVWRARSKGGQNCIRGLGVTRVLYEFEKTSIKV